MSHMSKDRIEFTVTSHMVVRNSGYAALLRECFGMEIPPLRDGDSFKVICRPSQFGRFCALRDERRVEVGDVQNNMADMAPRLIRAERRPIVIDVSLNPNGVE